MNVYVSMFVCDFVFLCVFMYMFSSVWYSMYSSIFWCGLLFSFLSLVRILQKERQREKTHRNNVIHDDDNNNNNTTSSININSGTHSEYWVNSLGVSRPIAVAASHTIFIRLLLAMCTQTQRVFLCSCFQKPINDLASKSIDRMWRH